MNEEYCKHTGRKVKVRCNREDADSIETYQACVLSSDDEQFRVIVFQLIMGIVGGLAYWGVQIRKKENMSLFDRRRIGT